MLLVVGGDGGYLWGEGGVVEVVGGGDEREGVVAYHSCGVGVEEWGVGLEVDYSSRGEHLAVYLKEVGACETLVDFLHLWIGECDPYLGHFSGGEEVWEEMDGGAKEGDVGETLVAYLAGSGPHACPFDVDAYEGAVGVGASHADGVFAFAASEFEGDGSGVVEDVLIPPAPEGAGACGFEVGKGVLVDAWERLHFGELLELVFSHRMSVVVRVLAEGCLSASAVATLLLAEHCFLLFLSFFEFCGHPAFFLGLFGVFSHLGSHLLLGYDLAEDECHDDGDEE